MVKALGHVNNLNNSKDRMNSMIEWEVDDETLGHLNEPFALQLRRYPDVFTVADNKTKAKKKLTFAWNLERASMEERTAALQRVSEDLRARGLIHGWRDELFPVQASYSDPPKLLLERAVTPYFGVKAYGMHLNGYVRHPQNRNITHLWVGRRAATKSTFPGMLDHLVAGGQPFGINIIDNMVKECGEEASIAPALARTAIPTGAVAYNQIDEFGNLKRDVMFCFDLELPIDFTPRPQDGDVESFQLREIGWVLERAIEGGGGDGCYKPNCVLVIFDFFIR